MDKVNLLSKFSLFTDPYHPRVVADLNDHEIKVVKLRGDFVWHHHEDVDELFLVMKGRMVMGLRTGDVVLEEGDLFVVPKGVEHKPSAEDECWIVLIEPRGTLNTGNVVGEKTVAAPERI